MEKLEEPVKPIKKSFPPKLSGEHLGQNCNQAQTEKHSVTYHCITIVSFVKDFEKHNSLGYIPRDSEMPGKLAAVLLFSEQMLSHMDVHVSGFVVDFLKAECISSTAQDATGFYGQLCICGTCSLSICISRCLHKYSELNLT